MAWFGTVQQCDKVGWRAGWTTKPRASWEELLSMSNFPPNKPQRREKKLSHFIFLELVLPATTNKPIYSARMSERTLSQQVIQTHKLLVVVLLLSLDSSSCNPCKYVMFVLLFHSNSLCFGPALLTNKKTEQTLLSSCCRWWS